MFVLVWFNLESLETDVELYIQIEYFKACKIERAGRYKFCDLFSFYLLSKVISMAVKK